METQIRLLDFLISLVALILLTPLLALLFLVCFADTRRPIFTQKRVGKSELPFTIYKFRTMKPGAGDIPTHLVSASLITKVGKFLRTYKLDELPQLINVLVGNMSLVGPRPSLPSQKELISVRRQFGVQNLKPGITGPAQIKGIEMSDPLGLVKEDVKLLENFNFNFYFTCILKTIMRLRNF